MSWCAQQMAWMQTWLDEVVIAHVTPGVIKGNNCGAITLATTKDHGKVKHINIQLHYLHKLIKSESVIFEGTISADNFADLFTKLLAHNHHHHLLVGNGTGNPGVFQANPYPYPSKPVPTYAGTGYLPAGVRVPQGSRVFTSKIKYMIHCCYSTDLPMNPSP